MALVYFLFVTLVLPIMLLVGWVYNAIWTFHQTDFVHLALGILGAIVAPIGGIHGLYLLFV